MELTKLMKSPLDKEISQLLPEEKEQMINISQRISLDDANSIDKFGQQAQEGSTSGNLLENIQNRDLGKIGKDLSDMMFKLKDTDPAKLTKANNIFARLLYKASKSYFDVKSQYEDVNKQVATIKERLLSYQIDLNEDIHKMDETYQVTVKHSKQLKLEILAGKKALDKIERDVMPKLIEKAKDPSTDQLEVQHIRNQRALADTLDKRIIDLVATRELDHQYLPQIKMIQQNDYNLIRGIDEAVLIALPAWQKQIGFTISSLKQKQVLEAEKLVTDEANKQIVEGSKLLHTNTVDIVRQGEAPTIKIETLRQSRDEIVNCLQEVMDLEKEGKINREKAVKELADFDETTRKQVLELQRNSHD